jgi:hypothetical protein
MPEQEPDEVILDIVGRGEFLMSRYNTRLFTFMGNLATRNHIFIQLDEVDESDNLVSGAYVFAHHEAYHQIFSFVVAHEYPMSLNNLEVSTGDEEAFIRSLDSLGGGEDIGDFIPDNFLF